MNQKILATSKRSSIEEVKEQFQNWRNTRENRSPIPDYLWQAAIDLSRDYTVNIISKTLSLSYSDLKRRVKAAGKIRPDNHPHFVEFNLDSEKTGECIVEMDNGNGSRMKIQMKGFLGNNILDLARAFWRMDQ